MGRAKRTATKRLMKYECMNCMDGGLMAAGYTCGICGYHKPLRKRQAKRSPARVSLQRRVGRSASDGQPEAVARPIGRKKAIQPGVLYKTIWSPIMDALLTAARQGAHLATRTEHKLGGDIVALAADMMEKINVQMKGRADAGRCNRQRAIPANARGERHSEGQQ